ncbi:hypothetical protein Tco_0807804, partial [Tanacetum coccineum]
MNRQNQLSPNWVSSLVVLTLLMLWDIKKGGVFKAIRWFWTSEEISRGCNASFVTLAPKVVILSDWGINIAHLQYANDVIFFGDWSKHNAKNLICVLKVFENVPGLKVNLSKSKLYGLGVSSGVVEEFARVIKCSKGELTLTYLGLPIRVSMRRELAWRLVIENFKKLLTYLKAKTMSFGGRLTLVKYVLESLLLYYFSIFHVSACVLNRLERLRRDFFWGGIGKVKNGLGSEEYSVVHGSKEYSCGRGWDGGRDRSSSIGEKVGDGASISFWNDVWVGDSKLCDRFSRLYHLESYKDVKVMGRGRWNGDRDTWKWSLDEKGVFSVKALSCLVEEKVRCSWWSSGLEASVHVAIRVKWLMALVINAWSSSKYYFVMLCGCG